ncbi:MAG: signal peptidase I [Gammaproteobacteria bacterium]|nr:signal peptidase I [Gammaproteobacteria bacterium]
MDIDFALVLVILVAVCGAIWLLDILLLKKIRTRNVQDFQQKQGAPRTQKQGEQELEQLIREPVVVEYAKSFFPVLLIVLVLRSFVIEPYQIPTGSMIPTLQVGDFILVNKYAYGLRLPVIGTKILEVGEPERGEVMVFIPPHENKYYIKRVIGLPGDRIRYEGKVLYVNGEEMVRDYVGPASIDFGSQSIPGQLYNEQLGDVAHPVQVTELQLGRQGRTSWIVPDGHYFMMGDNRDNSADSRVWGPVSETKIIGKAVAIWLHKDPGFNLPNFSRNQRIQ